MREIMVGFDGSEESRDALRLARLMVAYEDAKLTVAVVRQIDPLLLRTGMEAGSGRAYFDRLFAEARELVNEELTYEELPATAISPQDGLHRLARERDVDTVVVGSCHRGGLGRVVLGSVGESMLSSAPAGVAVAPRGYADSAPDALREIGIAWDGSPEARIALERAARLATHGRSKVRVLTVAPTYVDFAGEVQIGDDLRAKYSEILDQAPAALPEGVAHTTELLQGTVAAELRQRADSLDLLVVGSRSYGPIRRTLIGSTSRELFRSAACPVLVMPRPHDSVDSNENGESSARDAEAAVS